MKIDRRGIVRVLLVGLAIGPPVVVIVGLPVFFVWDGGKRFLIFDF